jgi:tetratricopeptide (TPR) repeat protein
MLRLDAICGKRLPLLACLILTMLVLGGCHRSPEARKAKFLESGKSFMQAKDYPRAILQFRNAAQVAPKDAEVYYQLALAFLANRDLRNGVTSLNEAIKLNPKHTAAKLKMAELEAMGNKQDVLNAETQLEDLLKSSPDDADALSTLAITELRLQKPEEAQKHLEAALQKSPANLKAAVAMAQLRKAQNDLKGAEDVLQAAVQTAPKSPDPLVALASFYMSMRKWPEANRSLEQALQIDSKNDAALLGLAAVQLHAGQKDKAEQTYAKLAALAPAQYKPLHAQFLLQEGKRDAAIAEFVKIAKDNPDDRVARTHLVSAYWAANRRAEAEKVLTDALKSHPKDVEALKQRSEIEIVAGRFTEAQADLDQAFRYRPDDPSAHYLRAKVYQGLGNGTLQRHELGEALRINKDLLGARLELAQALLQQHDGKAALALLDSKDVPDRQRGTLPVFVLYNYALMETGDFEKVRQRLEPALAKVKTPDLLLQDAMIKADKKDYAGARTSLESALKMSPEDLRALELLGKTYAAQNQVALGTQKIREHVAAQPKSARLQKLLGDWLAATGDHAGALQAYAAAKQLDPKLTAADMATVRIDMADNKTDAARQVLTRIMQAGDSSVEACLSMALIEERSGNIDAAISNYRKALGADANNVVALNNLAFLLAEHGQPQQLDEALKLAQQVRAIAPNSTSIEDTIGWVYYKKGIYKSAVQQLYEAVQQDNNSHVRSPLHHYHLAMAYLMNNQIELGQQELNHALKLNPNLPEAKQAMTLLAQKPKAASN